MVKIVRAWAEAALIMVGATALLFLGMTWLGMAL